MTGNNLQDKILLKARHALDTDADSSETVYNELIAELESKFGKNHKEVAAELQRLAKAIEDSDGAEQSFAFKQRTCEIMLRRSMEERRLARQNAQPASSASAPAMEKPSVPPKRLLSSLDYIAFPSEDVTRDAEFYVNTLKADIISETGTAPRTVALKLAHGTPLLLIEADAISKGMPLYGVEDIKSVIEQLTTSGLNQMGEPLTWANGTIYSFRDPSGNRFGLMQKKSR